MRQPISLSFPSSRKRKSVRTTATRFACRFQEGTPKKDSIFIYHATYAHTSHLFTTQPFQKRHEVKYKINKQQNGKRREYIKYTEKK